MISRTNMAIAVVSVAIGVTTFALTRSSQGQSTTTRQAPLDGRPRWGRVEAMARWLGLSDRQRDAIIEQDPTYWQDMIAQSELLTQEREKLARVLEDPGATDRQITDQVEQLIVVGNQIERRVVEHILAVRKHLTPEQQKKLFDLCALGIRSRMPGQGRGIGWGRGRGSGRGDGGFDGGPGAGRGRGGSGRGWGRGGDEPGRGRGRD